VQKPAATTPKPLRNDDQVPGTSSGQR
jgi:hypothetical protein